MPCTIPTRWAKDVDPAAVLPEYPRPQLVRAEWLNLNGSWDWAATDLAAGTAGAWQGRILVPFCIESLLSGVARSFTPDQRLWYHRTFSVPAAWAGRRVLLNFGAVDYEAEVLVNGASVGAHRGGFDAFAFDITDHLRAGGLQDLVVKVVDATDRARQPVGKQTLRQEGFWYTPVSGIWQTVWLEPVAAVAVTGLRMVPDPAGGRLRLTVATSAEATVTAVASASGKVVATASGPAGGELALAIPAPRLWSPADPFLYDLAVTVQQGARTTDAVTSYFGMRSVAVATRDGFPRVLLNGEPIVQVGLLDQGWWPDGLYTAPTDAALKFDIAAQKELGYNLIRKHIKVEPARWYAWADRLGMLVWQDMPSRVGERDPSCDAQFEHELERMVLGLANHPSIVTWIPFNESCGRYAPERVAKLVKEWDPTRLLTIDSGWSDAPMGDLADVHNYPTPSYPTPAGKPRVLGEHGCGALAVAGHDWRERRNWTDGPLTDGAALLDLYAEFADTTRSAMVTKGLVASVYTQVTDVENELNGLYTYDRAALKVDARRLAAINAALRDPMAHWYYTTLVETSERFNAGAPWTFTRTPPAAGWDGAGFAATGWSKGLGAFGAHSDRAHTTWADGEIWFRAAFTAAAPVRAQHFRLRIKYEGEIEVFLNGVSAFTGRGGNSMYRTVAPSSAAAAAIVPGAANAIAVHARKTGGGPYADAGVLVVTQPGGR